MKMFQSNKGFSGTLINKDFLKIRKRKKCLPLAFNYRKGVNRTTNLQYKNRSPD